MGESTAIVNHELQIRPKDIEAILHDYRRRLTLDRGDIVHEVQDNLMKVIRTVPEYKSLSEVTNTYFSVEFASRNGSGSTPYLILTPYVLGIRGDKENILPIYSLGKKEFIWGERYEIDPRILRELSMLDTESISENKALYEIYPQQREGWQVPLELCWVGKDLKEFGEYQEKLKETLEKGDQEAWMQVISLVKEFWECLVKLPILNLEATIQLETMTQRELASENPLLYSIYSEFILTDKYSNYGKLTGKKVPRRSTTMSKADIEAEINFLKSEIELKD